MAFSWYYAAGNRQVGPVSEAELDAIVSSGGIRKDTLVWRQGLENWMPYALARPEGPFPVEATAGVLPVIPEPSSDGQGTRYCTECGRPTPERELVAFGNRLVCATCKPAFVHQLRERGAPGAQYQYAGFWIRFAAKLIDGIILYIVIVPVMFLVLGTRAFDPQNPEFGAAFFVLQGFVFLFQLSISALYDIWFVANYAATPGKMAIGKKVIVADGTRMTYGRAAARHFATYISHFTLGIGFIIAAFDSQKRALHDRICDTRVVAK